MDWKSHFDHIYCFHYLPSSGRLAGIKEEFRRVGILDSGIFSFVYTSPDPMEKYIANVTPRVAHDEESNRGFVNLGLATARTFREALALGYRRVLFLENDIRFLKNLKTIEMIMERTPKDYAIVQYDKFLPWNWTPDRYRSNVERFRINDAFYDGGAEFLPSGGCFAADTQGMTALLNALERGGPRPVDGLFGAVGVRRAVAVLNVAIQVVFEDALLWKYLKQGNTHHKAYAPMELDYSLYNVPDGYGYEKPSA